MLVFALALLVVWFAALGEGRRAALVTDEWGMSLYRQEFKRALKWTLLLLVAQGLFIAAMYLAGGLKPALMIATNYIFMGLVLPGMWAGGCLAGQQAGLPWQRGKWSKRQKWKALGLVFLAGLVISAALFIIGQVRLGKSVTEMKDIGSGGVLVAMALWLMINAPWLEEIVFRHYLLVKLGRFFGGSGWRRFGLPLVITSALFAVGHAGHTDPAWPKLAQTFLWGLALGWVRLAMGTGYAVALHLGWNLSSPVIAPFIITE